MVYSIQVCGLGEEFASREKIYDVFSKCGEISEILYSPATGIRRGIAYIHYCNKNDAKSAIEKYDGLIGVRGDVPLTVNWTGSAPHPTGGYPG